MKPKKFSKGTGHAISVALIGIFVITLIIGKLIELDNESFYELMQNATYALILAIGIKVGMEITVREEEEN